MRITRVTGMFEDPADGVEEPHAFCSTASGFPIIADTGVHSAVYVDNRAGLGGLVYDGTDTHRSIQIAAPLHRPAHNSYPIYEILF